MADADWDSGWTFDDEAYPKLPKSLVREAKKRRKFDLTVEEVVKLPGGDAAMAAGRGRRRLGFTVPRLQHMFLA